MKINENIKFLGLLACSLMVGSCDSNEEVDPIIDIEKPVVTIDVAATATVQEGGTVPFTVTLSEPVGQPFTIFVLRQTSSTADELDSSVGNQSGVTFEQSFTVPAFVTTFTGVIEIDEDCIGEGDEVLNLVIGDTRTSAAQITPVTTSITIQNTISEAIDLVFDWEHEFSLDGDDYTLCDIGYDIDIIVYDSDYNYINDISAQTGDCPEELSLSMANYEDGTYFITAYLYGTGDFDPAAGAANVTGLDEVYSNLPFSLNPFAIPINVSYSRCGSLTDSLDETGGSFVANDMFTAQSSAGSEIYLLTIEIEDGQFTVINDTQTVDSGRVANKAKKPANRTPKGAL